MPTAAEALTPAAPAPTPAPAAAAPPAASNEPFFKDWTDPADKEIRDWVGNKNYPDVKTLARSALGLERLIGADRAGRVVALPADEYDDKGNLVKADEAGRKAYYAKIGVPESPDKYDIPLPADNPYPQFKNYMAQVFHENGVPSRTATALAKGYESAIAKMETEVRAQEDAKSQADMAELERAWGANYKERVAFAQRGLAFMAEKVGGLSDIQQRALEGVLGTAKFMTMMWQFGAGNAEARFAGTDTGRGNQFGATAGDAQSELNQILADRSAGKITDFAWRKLDAKGGKIDTLRDRIAAGFATQQ